jgi:hypothetical protein
MRIFGVIRLRVSLSEHGLWDQVYKYKFVAEEIHCLLVSFSISQRREDVCTISTRQGVRGASNIVQLVPTIWFLGVALLVAAPDYLRLVFTMGSADLLVDAPPSTEHWWPSCSVGEQENANMSRTLIRCFADAFVENGKMVMLIPNSPLCRRFDVLNE